MPPVPPFRYAYVWPLIIRVGPYTFGTAMTVGLTGRIFTFIAVVIAQTVAWPSQLGYNLTKAHPPIKRA